MERIKYESLAAAITSIERDKTYVQYYEGVLSLMDEDNFVTLDSILTGSTELILNFVHTRMDQFEAYVRGVRDNQMKELKKKIEDL